jgi:hypothetical protein
MPERGWDCSTNRKAHSSMLSLTVRRARSLRLSGILYVYKAQTTALVSYSAGFVQFILVSVRMVVTHKA